MQCRWEETLYSRRFVRTSAIPSETPLLNQWRHQNTSRRSTSWATRWSCCVRDYWRWSSRRTVRCLMTRSLRRTRSWKGMWHCWETIMMHWGRRICSSDRGCVPLRAGEKDTITTKIEKKHSWPVSNHSNLFNTALGRGILRFRLKVPPIKTRCSWAQPHPLQPNWWDNCWHSAMSQTKAWELDRGRQRRTSFINSKTLRTVLNLSLALSPRNSRSASKDASLNRRNCFWWIITSSWEWYLHIKWHFQSEGRIPDWWWWSQTSACIPSLTFLLSISIQMMFLCSADRVILQKA